MSSSNAGHDRADLPLRDLGEGLALSLLLGVALWFLAVPPALVWALTVFVAAIAYGLAMRVLDPLPARWVVGLARTTTFWCLGLPLMWLVYVPVFPPLLFLLLFWLLIEGGLGLGGTALIRRRDYRAGLRLKLISLIPYGLCLIGGIAQQMTFGDWMAELLGLSAAGLATGLVAAVAALGAAS